VDTCHCKGVVLRSVILKFAERDISITRGFRRTTFG